MAKRGGLGRGLSALIPGAAEEGGGLFEVPVTAVQPNPRQPRTVFDDEALDGLALSIREVGVLQPIVVRKVGNVYELIAGERRPYNANAIYRDPSWRKADRDAHRWHRHVDPGPGHDRTLGTRRPGGLRRRRRRLYHEDRRVHQHRPRDRRRGDARQRQIAPRPTPYAAKPAGSNDVWSVIRTVAVLGSPEVVPCLCES